MTFIAIYRGGPFDGMHRQLQGAPSSFIKIPVRNSGGSYGTCTYRQAEQIVDTNEDSTCTFYDFDDGVRQ